MRQRTYDYLVKPVPPEKLLTTIDRAGERWQRRRAEEALRQSEERAQLLLEHISDVVMVVDDALVFRYVSPSVRRLLDYLPNELVGRRCLDVVTPRTPTRPRPSSAARFAASARCRHTSCGFDRATATGACSRLA